MIARMGFFITIAVAVVAVILLTGGEQKGQLTFAIFDRAATEADRAPQDQSASALRTQEQTGELRFAGEFRGHRAYVGRDVAGSCMFDAHEGAVGSTCGPGPLEFKSLTAVGRDETIAFVVIPDGMRWRVYEGRAGDTRELENVVAVAFRERLTLRFEGLGRSKDVELSG